MFPQLQIRDESCSQTDQALAYRWQSSPCHTSIRFSLSSEERHVPLNRLAEHEAAASFVEVTVSTTERESVRAAVKSTAMIWRSGMRAEETCVIVNLR
ncbi:hypothetical protein DEJ46_36870 [Streptomyces venezuelae]|uniref:Uncharacterized protein n=1 Tax=Streptomyces venezuelae TaxID=54571 RepID=A0A5P2B4E1_STRVZ|nr:hypothetical protein DEJ46_36870 [Streptomyces venezuelae]